MTPKKTLSQKEADALLNMLKKSLSETVEFPSKGKSLEFDLVGDTKKELFTAKIYRGRINSLKYEMGARIKKDGILLLELHVNPGKVHPNPDGSKIIGSHWHIYTEEYGRQFAIPAEDVQSDNFVKNTLLFLEKFNVIKQPNISFQLELV